MIKILFNLLADLKNEEINYCIFKEFENPKDLLNGNDGDIDILIDSKQFKQFKTILNNNGFMRAKPNFIDDGIFYYIGLDLETGKFILLHVHTKLRIGDKINKEYHYNFESIILNDKKLNVEYNFYHIDETNEILLLFARMILKNNPKQEDIDRLLFLSNNLNIEKERENYICRRLYGVEFAKLIEQIQKDVFFSIESQKSNIKKYLFKNKMGVILRKINGNISRLKKRIHRVLKYPNYKIRRFGKIYVLQGVDGAGKTTQINKIKENEFLKLTGLKTIYGGNNQYWIPFLEKGLKKYANKNGLKDKIIKKFLSILSIIDRRCRIIYAFKYTIKGYNVVFDRYFYDDLASLEILKLRGKKVKLINKILKGTLGVRPKIAFFLSLSPEEAYKRKQDYEFEKVVEVIEAYNNMFRNRKEVDIIDATKSINQISLHIINKIAYNNIYDSDAMFKIQT